MGGRHLGPEGRCDVIPRTLDEWTIPVITTLLAQGYYESREFDFKEKLPESREEGGKDRLRAACCAFANSPGGFLVFGVTDSNTDPIEKRLVGLPPNLDFPEHFGVHPQQCTPGVRWEFRNPPLPLLNGNVIHVVQIPQSWDAPHCYRPEPSHPERWRFPKRTDKGTEDMSYEEVRLTFLQYYEKRVKLQLLRAELDTIVATAQEMQKPWNSGQSIFARGEFGLAVVETVLSDTYTILASAQDAENVLSALARIRMKCREMNQEMQRWMASVGYERLEPTFEPLRIHNGFASSHGSYIETTTQQVIRWLDKLLATP